MYSFKAILFFCFLLLSGITVHAQLSATDSLRNVISNSNNDKARLDASRALTKAFLFKDFDESLAAATTGAALAEKLKDYSSLGELQKSIGMSWYFKGSYDSAAIYYFKALEVLKKTNDLPKKAEVLNELGKLFRKTKDLDRALQMYDEAFAIYKDINDDNNMATILNESGVVFEYKVDYPEALNRYRRSLAIREKLNDKIKAPGFTNCIIQFFANGNCFLKKIVSLCIITQFGIAHARLYQCSCFAFCIFNFARIFNSAPRSLVSYSHIIF